MLGKSWNWSKISQNPSITLDKILDHPTLPWDWKYVARNKNVTMNHLHLILDHSEVPGFWEELSFNQNLTVDVVLQYPNKPWRWQCVR